MSLLKWFSCVVVNEMEKQSRSIDKNYEAGISSKEIISLLVQVSSVL